MRPWIEPTAALFRAFLRRGLRNSIATSSLLGATLRRKLEHTFLAKDGNSWASFYFDNFFSAFGEAEQSGLLTSEFAREAAPSTAYKNVLDYWEHSSGEMLQRLLYTDIKTYLVELLMKQDNMSMAASIESRVPFLDHVLVEFATRIPREVQIQGLAGKRILEKGGGRPACRTRFSTGRSWDFRRRGADGWPGRDWKRFARCCWNRAA